MYVTYIFPLKIFFVSLVVRLKTKNLDEDLLKILDSLDTSNFPKDHPLRIESRGSKLGYFKSETGTK